MSAFTIVGMIRAKKGKEKTVDEAVRQVTLPTRAERGCISYRVLKVSKQQGTYYFFQEWSSREDYERHLQSPHIRARLKHKPEWLDFLDIIEVDELFQVPQGRVAQLNAR